MVFSSLLFIFGFLPLFLVLYFVTPDRFKNLTALAASLLFYSWGAPKFLLIILAISWIDYALSWKIHRTRTDRVTQLRWLTFGIILNLACLFYFKYAGFFAEQVNAIARAFGPADARWIHWGKIMMPIGISFIVFEEISYLVDVYRGRSQPASKFANYALFLFLFPHSIAGPIFRWHDLEKQLIERKHSVDMVFDGTIRFFMGLAKKVLLADRFAAVADLVFSQSPDTLPAAYAWLGMTAYTLQIYFDFSGYSDMAIGIGSILGFKFKENFNAPYIATSITDFWRRWHISLSTWMRDYLYIPLGGNRISARRTYINLAIVFLASGFWHGANWTFLTWGAFHGALLILDRLFLEDQVLKRVPRIVAVSMTLFSVMIGWVLFRSESISYAGSYILRLFAFGDTDAYFRTEVSYGELLSHRTEFLMIIGGLICLAPFFTGVSKIMTRFMSDDRYSASPALFSLFRYALGLVLIGFVTLSLTTSSFSPFIYFRF